MSESVCLLLSAVSVLVGFVLTDFTYISDGHGPALIKSPLIFYTGIVLLIIGMLTFPWIDSNRIISHWFV